MDSVTPPGGGTPAAEPVILVVDDDPQLRQMIRWALEDEGLLVQTAADGLQAIDSVSAERPALILLDIGLPIIDGYGVAERVHALSGGPVPIVAITADGRAAEKARRVGAQAYLQKPFEIDDLLDTVQRTLERSVDGG